jgi:FkbM family methyltransferase
MLSRIGLTRIKSKFGFSLIIDPCEFIGRYLYVYGHYEPEVESFLSANLKPGDCFIDIGANLGYFTLLARSLVGIEGRVYAFEPDAWNFARLEANLKLNDFDDTVLAFRLAIAAHDGEMDFWIAGPTNRGLSSGRTLQEVDAHRTVTECARLDSKLSELAPVKVVKLDIEGGEYKALIGMTQLLERDKPFVLYESTDQFLQEMGSSSEQVLAFLVKRGYSIYKFGTQGLVKISEAPIDQCNLVAVHRSRKELVLDARQFVL